MQQGPAQLTARMSLARGVLSFCQGVGFSGSLV